MNEVNTNVNGMRQDQMDIDEVNNGETQKNDLLFSNATIGGGMGILEEYQIKVE